MGKARMCCLSSSSNSFQVRTVSTSGKCPSQIRVSIRICAVTARPISYPGSRMQTSVSSSRNNNQKWLRAVGTPRKWNDTTKYRSLGMPSERTLRRMFHISKSGLRFSARHVVPAVRLRPSTHALQHRNQGDPLRDGIRRSEVLGKFAMLEGDAFRRHRDSRTRFHL